MIFSFIKIKIKIKQFVVIAYIIKIEYLQKQYENLKLF